MLLSKRLSLKMKSIWRETVPGNMENEKSRSFRMQAPFVSYNVVPALRYSLMQSGARSGGRCQE